MHSVHFDFTLQQCLYSVMNWLKHYWNVRKQHAHTLLYKLNIADKAYELFYKLMEAERLREGTKFLMCKAGIYACVKGSVFYTLKLNEEDRKYFLDDRDYGLYTACNRLCVGWLDTTEVSVGFPTWEGKSRFSSQVSSIDTALAWVREIACSSPVSSNALMKIECAWNSLGQGTHC